MGFLYWMYFTTKKCDEYFKRIKKKLFSNKKIKIYAEGKKCKIGTFWKIATITLSLWLFFERCKFGIFLLHEFSKFLWVINNFSSYLDYLSHILTEKILLMSENPNFSITKRIKLLYFATNILIIDFSSALVRTPMVFIVE